MEEKKNVEVMPPMGEYDRAIMGIMQRQTAKGLHKYGAPLEDNVTLTSTQRIDHLEEELVDGLRYAEHLRRALSDSLTANDYQRAALRTAEEECRNLANAGLGLGGEAGECSDLIKKHMFQGHPLDPEKLRDELGDVLWYVALTADLIGYTLEDIMWRNVEKLLERYPDGFDKDRSIHRPEECQDAD